MNSYDPIVLGYQGEVRELNRRIDQLEARLARYDDDRPIDEDGLRELGVFTESFNNMLGTKFDCRIGPDFEVDHHVYLFWSARHGVTIGSTLSGTYPLRRIQTIGQLAHLLDALGIGGGDSNSNEGVLE